MKNKFLNNYMNIIIKNNPNLSDEQLEKMKYGIEGIYLTVTKLFVVLLLAIFFDIIKEVLILLLFYNVLRFFGFGYHAKNSKECLIFSILFFFVLPFVVVNKYLIFKYDLLIIIICLINFLLFAPSDTKKRPMINKRKKKIRKLLLVVITIIYSIFILVYKSKYSSLLLLSILIESFMVNPLIYMVTGEPYNNYKNYKK